MNTYFDGRPFGLCFLRCSSPSSFTILSLKLNCNLALGSSCQVKGQMYFVPRGRFDGTWC